MGGGVGVRYGAAPSPQASQQDCSEPGHPRASQQDCSTRGGEGNHDYRATTTHPFNTHIFCALPLPQSGAPGSSCPLLHNRSSSGTLCSLFTNPIFPGTPHGGSCKIFPLTKLAFARSSSGGRKRPLLSFSPLSGAHQPQVLPCPASVPLRSCPLGLMQGQSGDSNAATYFLNVLTLIPARGKQA